jgi:hypothetical protein
MTTLFIIQTQINTVVVLGRDQTRASVHSAVVRRAHEMCRILHIAVYLRSIHSAADVP